MTKKTYNLYVNAQEVYSQHFKAFFSCLVNAIYVLICILSITPKILLSVLLFFPQGFNVGMFSCVIQLSEGIPIAI